MQNSRRSFFTSIVTLGFVCIFIFEAKVLGIPPEDDFITEVIKDPTPVVGAMKNHIFLAFDQGRRHLQKSKKFLRSIYPLLMVVLFAKLIVIPLVVKILIAATSSAFVMSKIALVTSALMVLSWLLGLSKETTKFQILQHPASKFDGSGWNVKERYTPYYAPSSSYIDWPYDGSVDENKEQITYL